MQGKSFFFAGGGTGGHIYPAVAVAEQIIKLEPDARIHFFCSNRDIDARILSGTDFSYTALPAQGFSIQPGKLISFCTSFFASCRIANEVIGESENVIVTGIGGFVAAPACYAAQKLKIPVALLNVDIVPGRANKVIGHWADEIFVQFEDTAEYFAKSKARVNVFGCPVRSGFSKPEPGEIRAKLGLDDTKKTLLITGASSGSENINEAVCSLLDKIDSFEGDWQIVHLAGVANFEKVQGQYANVKIRHNVLAYCDDMANLLSITDLVIGRSGAVSVAEYAAAGVPSICMPYPYHKDRHQYLNAGKLVEAGAGIIVDDLPDANDRAEWLWEELEELLKNDEKRREMRERCAKIRGKDAALKIAERLLEMVRSEARV